MKTETPSEVTETPVLAIAREIFKKMKGSVERFRFDISEADLYRKACDIEQESKTFYLDRAREAEDPDQKRIFRELAEEENKHLFLVRNICDFVSRPETYLEDAEFYHFDDYIEEPF